VIRDPRRRFNSAERAALIFTSGGMCEECGAELKPGWHADHVSPHSKGGRTDIVNAQSLCPTCNLKKGSKTVDLRSWQIEALRRFSHASGDFLVVAAPGAGKTRVSLVAAERLMQESAIEKIVVVVPTAHLRTQWAQAAHLSGIQLDDTFTNGAAILAGDYDGAVVTYQSVAMSPIVWRRLASARRTLVVLDEIHHAADSENLSWGPALRHAFELSTRRLLLSGTPFRSDGHPIPFVTYDEGGRCVPGYDYDYGKAIADGGVVRAIEFPALNSHVQWRNAGSIESTTLDEASDDTISKALRVALDPAGDWIPSVLAKADEELSRIREDVPDAGGLVLASDQQSARQYAQHLRRISGEEPVVAVSDDPSASVEIERFSRGRMRWIVAVRMVSEGVDIPRLTVGVYATNVRTQMFVQQVVGRFVRLRGLLEEPDAMLFIPSIAPLLRIAADIERTVDAALRDASEREMREAKEESGPRVLDLVEPISSTEASMHSTIRSGAAYGEEELRAGMEAAELAGLGDRLRPTEAAAFMRIVSGRQVVGRTVLRPEPAAPPSLSQVKKADRAIISRQVGRLHRLTEEEHKSIHYRLKKATDGLPIAQATTEGLRRRMELLEQWITGNVVDPRQYE
jgi:superfamily II DNA or RNA helicase